MDVKATYLNANLDEKIYMEVPPGFDIPNGHVLRLKKGVYSMKQGGCHGLVAVTGYLDFFSHYQTAGFSFSISDLISSYLPLVVTRYFYALLIPSPSFLPFPVPTIVGSSMFSHLSAHSVCFRCVPASFPTLQ
jgi:hypothetical protein